MTALRRWLSTIAMYVLFAWLITAVQVAFGYRWPDRFPWWLHVVKLVVGMGLLYVHRVGHRPLAWGRFLCWAHSHQWGDYGDITGREHCSRCGLLRWPKLSDITPGWQERAEKFRETVRTCAHPYHERARSNRKGWFCMWCGRLLNEDGSER